jgi:hypothetical protein
VSCALSGNEGSTSYIKPEKTRNKLTETKDNTKKINTQTNIIKINIKKKKKKKYKYKQQTRVEFDYCCKRFVH